MKIIALPDLHSDTRRLHLLAADLTAADVVLLPGDLTNGRLEDAHAVLQAVRYYNRRMLAVPGNMDSHAIHDYLRAEGVDIHVAWQEIDGIAFIGMGGALPYYGSFVFQEDRFAEFFTQVTAGLNHSLPLVLVCHQPPYGTKVDRLSDGKHVGSTAVRHFIETTHPLLCFSGHLHEATGIDRLGATQLLNPGPLRSGGYGWVELTEGKVASIEIRQIGEKVC